MNIRLERFEDWEAEQMQDPEFRAAVEELEPAYQAERLRITHLAEAERGEGENEVATHQLAHHKCYEREML